MSKKAKKDLRYVLNATFLIIGFVWLLYIAENPPWYSFFVIVIVCPTLAVFIVSRIPDKQHTKKQPSKTTAPAKTKSTGTAKAQNKEKKTDQQIIAADLEHLDGYEFERLVAMYYDAKGYKPELTKGSGDHEVDLILTDPKENYKIAVQCKHWKTKNVGNDVIIRLVGGKRTHKCIDAWCITTSNYTKTAQEAAELNKVKIFNKLHVYDTIVKWQLQQREKLKK